MGNSARLGRKNPAGSLGPAAEIKSASRQDAALFLLPPNSKRNLTASFFQQRTAALTQRLIKRSPGSFYQQPGFPFFSQRHPHALPEPVTPIAADTASIDRPELLALLRSCARPAWLFAEQQRR